MKTDTQTLARAMDILSRDIQSQDGIANAAIREAAERLRELDGKIDADLTRLERERDEALKDLAFRRELFKAQEAQLNELRAERDEAREKATTAWTENLRLDSENRRLERDSGRDELRTALQDRHDIHWALKDAERERDELRAELIQLQALELNNEGACVRLKRERDEARELADSYRIAFCSANGFDRTPEPFPWEVQS
jgi:chromosome segregation ATPase